MFSEAEMVADILAHIFAAAAIAVIAIGAFKLMLLHAESNAGQPKPFSIRLRELTTNLQASSKQVDEVIKEISGIAETRQAAIKRLETDLENLEAREKSLKERVDLLEKIPIPVAEHLATVMQPGERRSAVRDYILFLAGVVTSTIISIVLHLVGLA
jgi:hypothetical protein